MFSHSAICLGQVKAAADMNVLGVITASLFFGLCLTSLGAAADGWVAGVGVFNAVIAKMVAAVLWLSPLGVASLIAAAVVRSCTLASVAAALGLWAGTVLVRADDRMTSVVCFRLQLTLLMTQAPCWPSAPQCISIRRVLRV